MNILPANEVKRHGIKIVEELLKTGPVHIIKNNRLACVVLSEQEFQELINMRERQSKPMSILFEMLSKPATGKRTRKEIDTALRKERNHWDK